jgi:hypothetical protein
MCYAVRNRTIVIPFCPKTQSMTIAWFKPGRKYPYIKAWTTFNLTKALHLKVGSILREKIPKMLLVFVRRHFRLETITYQGRSLWNRLIKAKKNSFLRMKPTLCHTKIFLMKTLGGALEIRMTYACSKAHGTTLDGWVGWRTFRNAKNLPFTTSKGVTQIGGKRCLDATLLAATKCRTK